MQNKFCVIFFERKIQGSALAGSYISLEEVILNKSLTRRQANITALAISLADRQISQIRLRIYLVAESLAGTRLVGAVFSKSRYFLQLNQRYVDFYKFFAHVKTPIFL